jgi:SAM-dependent methyltransferase
VNNYREDLAYINDAGFSDFTTGTTPGVLAVLRREGVRTGLVVDLGCGSGRFAHALGEAGYDVLGVDLSPAMIRLARKRAPRARFESGSLFSTNLPPCDAVTAIGEIVNYQFDAKHSRAALTRVFRKVHEALRPGGMFVFDVAGPDRVPAELPGKYWKEGHDWSMYVEVDGNAHSRWMTRKIVCFRKNAADRYRRSEEMHRLRLLDAAEVVTELKAIGFRASDHRGYGRFRLYPGMRAVVARKLA